MTDRVSGWGAVNSGFRAPTLTELYRQFSVGAVTTRPNDQLGPERLVGGEAGINVAPARNVTARVDLVRQPRRRIRSRTSRSTPTHGAEAEPRQDAHLGRADATSSTASGSSWRVSAAYLYDQAKVTDGGVANAALVGKYLRAGAEAPRARCRWRIRIRSTRTSRSACSSSALQFNDDLNVKFIPAADADRRRVRRVDRRRACPATPSWI